MSFPLVSVVIPTHNRKKKVIRLINSIISGSYKNLEIIAIDDNSTDNTYQDLRKKFKLKNKVKILRNKKNMFAAASRNKGLKISKGKYILFIDDDNVIDKKMISILVKEMEEDSNIGEIGPVNYSYANKKKILWSKTERNMRTSKTNQLRSFKGLGTKPLWKSDDILNSYMVRKEIIKKHKILLKEKYGIMYEESDLAYRIRSYGYKVVVVRKAKIFHDIEKYKNGQQLYDYMHHFMIDRRRPYVIARNRIIFHSVFSSKSEFIEIVTIWMWVFAAYYTKKILFYPGKEFGYATKLNLISSYYMGIFDGIFFVAKKESLK